MPSPTLSYSLPLPTMDLKVYEKRRHAMKLYYIKCISSFLLLSSALFFCLPFLPRFAMPSHTLSYSLSLFLTLLPPPPILPSSALYHHQVVTRRCRLSWLTNSALVHTSPNAGGWGGCGVSANENSCAHHVTWSPSKLWTSNSIFNL
jgi:hypothetical protein